MNNTIQCEWCGAMPAVLVHRVERQKQMAVALLDGTIIIDDREEPDREWDEAYVCRECAPAFFGNHYTPKALSYLLAQADACRAARRLEGEIFAENARNLSVNGGAKCENKDDKYEVG